MAKKTVKNYTLYKLRFWLGYGILSLIIATILITGALHTSGGLSDMERQSVITSASLSLSNPSSAFIFDLPYHALQKLSISLLGLNDLSVKLPSLLLGAASIVGLILVLSRRFTHTASILAVGIIVVSAKFISLATTGTPEIMHVFWPVMLLLVAVCGVSNNSFRPIAIIFGALTVGLSLLTPFSIYVIAAFCIGAAFHPRVRYLVRRTPNSAWGVGAFIGLISGVAVALMTLRDTAILPQLLYMSSSFSLDVIDNIKLLGLQLGDVTSMSTKDTGLLAPVFGMSVIAIGLFGTYGLLRARHTVLSYTLFSWTILLTPLILLNPGLFSLLIVPTALFLAIGISTILQYWYRLFPQNPYARIFALVPTAILFSCIIIPSAFHYFHGYRYYAPLANMTNNDTALMARNIDAYSNATVLVSDDEEAFYRVFLDANNKDNELATIPESSTRNSTLPYEGEIIATEKASTKINRAPTYIVANATAHGTSDRLYIYKISSE